MAGYGRTATDWVPTKVHTTTHTVGAVAATTIDTAPADGQAAICQGDAGAPLLRDKNGTTELAAIASRSWQGGVSISERPAEADDRAVPGHWEGDRATRSCTSLSGLADWRGG